MKIKVFIRTFTTAEDAEMFNSVLHTKWPTLLDGKRGARFRLIFDPKKPHVSTVVWEFENENIQKEIEKLISDEIVKFTKVLSNKEMEFSGKVILDFAT